MSKDSKNKKTLSLKLGSKPIITPARGFETGKTVIVEKKRFRPRACLTTSSRPGS